MAKFKTVTAQQREAMINSTCVTLSNPDRDKILVDFKELQELQLLLRSTSRKLADKILLHWYLNKL